MLKRFSFFILLFALKSMTANAQGQEREAALKAAFIYNFTKYIDWNTSIQDKFIIGIMETSPVYDALLEIAQKNTVNGKRILVRKFFNADDISFCNILFIPANTTFSLSSILARVDKGTLTISEEEGFAEMGTAFNFVIVHDKLKFEANVNSINAAGLKASSQLLKLAKIVD
jgi:YfiR/HmsC-like